MQLSSLWSLAVAAAPAANRMRAVELCAKSPQTSVLVAAERQEHAHLATHLQADAADLLAAAKLSVELSLSLCDDDAIRQLNQRYRQIDRPTDVLSFPQDDDYYVGDVVICVDVAQRQAAERGHSVRDEVRVLLVHVLLHLLGYDHETSAAAAAEMSEADGRLLSQRGWADSGLIIAAGCVSPDGG